MVGDGGRGFASFYASQFFFGSITYIYALSIYGFITIHEVLISNSGGDKIVVLVYT